MLSNRTLGFLEGLANASSAVYTEGGLQFTFKFSYQLAHSCSIPSLRESLVTADRQCLELIGADIQELGRWLEMGVAVALHRHSKNGIEEALDLIDAYGEHFLSEDTGKGALILGNLLAALEEPAARFELWEDYKALINQLYPIT